MNAEIITAGTELLLGRITDTNAVYLSRKLAETGIDLFFRTSVGDNKKRLISALSAACERAGLIIITGGLGPTVDDITREAVAGFTGKKLVCDKEELERIRGFFKKLKIKMPDSNERQAYIPENAVVMQNDFGTAAGFIVEHNKKIIAVMPGVPAEMKPMAEKVLFPYLKSKTGNHGEVIISKSIKTAGLPESLINDKIKDFFESSKNPSVALLAHQNEIEVRITTKAGNETRAREMAEPLVSKVYGRLGENIFGEYNDTLESKTAEFLLEKNLTISTAESCTSGILASRLTSVPGSSGYFTGGINAYSNEVKVNMLGVSSGTIEKHGAVSRECAGEMAEKCAEKFKTDIAVSTTGIAGPGGGSAEKPVGLVYIGLSFKGDTEVFKNVFPGTRKEVRARAANTALFEVFRGLRKL